MICCLQLCYCCDDPGDYVLLAIHCKGLDRYASTATASFLSFLLMVTDKVFFYIFFTSFFPFFFFFTLTLLISIKTAAAG